MMRSTTIISALAALMILAGCRSQSATMKSVVSDADVTELFAALAQSYNAYTDVYLPVTVTIKEPIQFSISGRATIVRDKELMVSLRVLGMEVAYVYVNTDSLYVVDKYHKMYFSESLGALFGNAPLTVGNMQDILLGRMFEPGGTTITTADRLSFRLLETKYAVAALPMRQTPGVDCRFDISRTSPPLLNDVEITPASGSIISCRYNEQVSTPAGPVASTLDISAPLAGKEAAIELKWSVGDAKWDDSRQCKFTPPGDNYRRISLDQLLHTLKNM